MPYIDLHVRQGKEKVKSVKRGCTSKKRKKERKVQENKRGVELHLEEKLKE